MRSLPPLPAPSQGCVVILADAAGDAAADARQADAVAAALDGGAAAAVLLCGLGLPLAASRRRLAALDAALGRQAAAAGWRVSRSATDGAAAWAACRHVPLGIDVQCAPASLDEALLRAALDDDERQWLDRQSDGPGAFASLWAGKEAVLKAFGVGLAWPPARVPVLPAPDGWQRVEIAALGVAWLSRPACDGLPAVALAVALNAGQPAAPR
jgi:4'-phosphopantetheinyl transferase